MTKDEPLAVVDFVIQEYESSILYSNYFLLGITGTSIYGNIKLFLK